jgi:hypothetical protein
MPNRDCDIPISIKILISVRRGIPNLICSQPSSLLLSGFSEVTPRSSHLLTATVQNLPHHKSRLQPQVSSTVVSLVHSDDPLVIQLCFSFLHHESPFSTSLIN